MPIHRVKTCCRALEEPRVETTTKKTCPFCAEEILVEAQKCKHCGQFLVKKDDLGRATKHLTMFLLTLIAVGAVLYFYFQVKNSF